MICTIVRRAEFVFYELADHKGSINHVKQSHLLFLFFADGAHRVELQSNVCFRIF